MSIYNGVLIKNLFVGEKTYRLEWLVPEKKSLRLTLMKESFMWLLDLQTRIFLNLLKPARKLR